MERVEEGILKIYEEQFLQQGVSADEIVRALAGVCLPETLEKPYDQRFLSLLERVQTVSCEEVIIRPDCPLDLSYNMLHSFSREVFDNPYFEDEPDIEQRCLVLDLLQGSQRVVGGGIWFSVGPKPELADMLYIKVLYLKEEFRRMGYGKRLVETAIDEGSACDTVYLRAPSSAWRFYEEVGFSMIDTYKVKGKLFGSFFKRLS